MMKGGRWERKGGRGYDSRHQGGKGRGGGAW